MAQIGEISTVVTAKTAPFQKGMKRAHGEAKRFKKSANTNIAGTLKKSVMPAMQKFTGFLTGPAGIVAGLASAGLAARRFFGMLGEQAGKLDEIGKTARRLDMATGELMALQFAGEQTGVSFNELQKGLEKFNKRVGLAAQGSGEAATMMEQMGINAQEFIRLPMSERLATIAGRIDDAGTSAEKAAIADRFFGRAGASSLLNLLQKGDEGIQALTKTARDLGIAMESHVVASIEQANDTMNRFSNRAEGLKKQITADLWPALGIMLEDIEKFEQKTGMLKTGKERTLGQKLIDLYTRYVPMGIVGRPWIERGRARQGTLKNEQPLPSGTQFRQSREQRQERLQERQLEAQLKLLGEQRRLREMQEEERGSPRQPIRDRF